MRSKACSGTSKLLCAVLLILCLFAGRAWAHKRGDQDAGSVVPLPAPQRTWQSSGNTTYYVNSLTGSDDADGKSLAHAWKTLSRVNSGTFAPGDRILLRAGSHWNGFLSLAGSGTAAHPIQIDSYDEDASRPGHKPQIDGLGATQATLYLHNVEYWDIANLDISSRSKRPVAKLTGLLVTLHDFGTAHSIHLTRLDIHDIDGSLVKNSGGNAICISCDGNRVRSRFDDLRIEDCLMSHIDRNGITMGGNWTRDTWYPSLHVVIRNNRLEDIGGDGIVPTACDGALVEHNKILGGRMRCEDSAAGIWPWSCDNTVVQFNEVSGMRGTNDGQGYDADWNCQNSLFQYNYSHDNEGGFMLICCDGTSKLPYNIGTTGTIIRYNISENDGTRTFEITGPCKDTLIYNNVLYLGRRNTVANSGAKSSDAANSGSKAKSEKVFVVQAGNWGGPWPEDTRFFNNIFYVEPEASADCNFGQMSGTLFDTNLFFGPLAHRPQDPHTLQADPFFFAPGKGIDGYHLRPESPCLHAGRPMLNNGGRDFVGTPIPTVLPPDLGVFQTLSKNL